jgi:hypothetical protein
VPISSRTAFPQPLHRRDGSPDCAFKRARIDRAGKRLLSDCCGQQQRSLKGVREIGKRRGESLWII